jgi:hypothetical protein
MYHGCKCGLIFEIVPRGAPQIGLRLPPPELASIDAWIKEQPKPKPSRPAAIRRLVEIGLKKGK